ncbi:SHOCT domain-containing protein [Actinoplanes sp. NPDC049316]|uniref:SHOCT domain-containing protein n=1 Tax=Actinoplanes sp. NPDC049316 TaxID=3154727 RepID=UPI0034249CB0
MMFYGNGMGAGGWILMLLTVALLATLVVVVIVRPLSGHDTAPPAPRDPVADAERVLADRLARGDIDTAEYEQRLHTLRAARR